MKLELHRSAVCSGGACRPPWACYLNGYWHKLISVGDWELLQAVLEGSRPCCFCWRKGDGSEMCVGFFFWANPTTDFSSLAWGSWCCSLTPSTFRLTLDFSDFSGISTHIATPYTVWYLFQWPLSGAIEVINRDSQTPTSVNSTWEMVSRCVITAP